MSGYRVARKKVSRKLFDAAIQFNFGEVEMGFRKAENNSKAPAPGKEAPSQEFRNEVHVAGKVHGIWMREESAFLLVNTGRGKSFIPCTLRGEEDARLADKLDRFKEGDQIAIVGYVNPYSVKKDGEWVRHCDVRITEIVTPAPQQQSTRQPPASWGSGENDPW